MERYLSFIGTERLEPVPVYSIFDTDGLNKITFDLL
jgi:hypothetical protein